MKNTILVTILAGQLVLASAASAENGVIIGKLPFGCKDKKQYQTLVALEQNGDRTQMDKGIAAAMITGDCYKFGLNEAIEIVERDAKANLAKVHPKKLPKIAGKNEFYTTASQVILKK